MDVLPSGPRGRRLPRRPVVLGSTAALVLTAGGVGYAAWSATATGSSEARSTTAQTLTVTGSLGAADLYPGGSGTAHFSVRNPNPYPVRLTTASFGTVASDEPSACPDANVTAANKTGLTLDIAADAAATLSIPAAVTMATTAPDGCQGRTFTVTTTLTGTSR